MFAQTRHDKGLSGLHDFSGDPFHGRVNAALLLLAGEPETLMDEDRLEFPVVERDHASDDLEPLLHHLQHDGERRRQILAVGDDLADLEQNWQNVDTALAGEAVGEVVPEVVDIDGNRAVHIHADVPRPESVLLLAPAFAGTYIRERNGLPPSSGVRNLLMQASCQSYIRAGIALARLLLSVWHGHRSEEPPCLLPSLIPMPFLPAKYARSAWRSFVTSAPGGSAPSGRCLPPESGCSPSPYGSGPMAPSHAPKPAGAA